MIEVRRSEERGRTRLDWLDSRHTFSFGTYQDPRFGGFRSLRVINDDVVRPAGGFGAHPHRDMEIFTYVLEGALEHRDSLGNGSVIRAGDLQRMTAGTGITHSEFNASSEEPVHFLQIWIVPETSGLAPGYEQRSFADHELRGRFRVIASPERAGKSVGIHQDARVLAARLDPGTESGYVVPAGRHTWLQLVRGAVEVNGGRLEAGDGAAVRDEPELGIRASGVAEVLLFDLA